MFVTFISCVVLQFWVWRSSTLKHIIVLISAVTFWHTQLLVFYCSFHNLFYTVTVINPQYKPPFFFLCFPTWSCTPKIKVSKLIFYVFRKYFRPCVHVPASHQHRHFHGLDLKLHKPRCADLHQAANQPITIYFTAMEHIVLGDESSQEPSSSSGKAIVSVGAEQSAHPLCPCVQHGFVAFIRFFFPAENESRKEGGLEHWGEGKLVWQCSFDIALTPFTPSGWDIRKKWLQQMEGEMRE